MREFSVPAPFTVDEHDNIVAAVFEHERDDPDTVIFQRLVDGVWTDVTCAAAAAQIRSAALGLIALGVQAGDRVAILSATRYEWAILDLRDPVGRRGHRPDLRDVVGRAGALGADRLRQRWSRSPRPTPTRRWSPSSPVTCLSCGACCKSTVRAAKPSTQLEQDGASVDPAELTARVEALRSEDPATLIYTSGTTGRPKGCQLTHSNLVYETRGAKAVLPTLLRKGERLLVFLPLAHVLARATDRCGLPQQGRRRVQQRHQESGADVRGVQADGRGVGAPGVREGVQHRRAKRRQRRQGPHLRDRRADRSRLERGAGPRRPRSAAAGQARAVRPAGVRQAARRAGWRLPCVCLGRRTAGRAAGPLLPRRRSHRSTRATG